MLSLALALFMQDPVHAVAVIHVGEDRTGAAVATRLEDEIDRSPRFTLPSRAKPGRAYTLHIVSLGTDYSMDQISVYSVALMDGSDELLAHTVGYCSPGNADACAAAVYEWAAPAIERNPPDMADLANCAIFGC